MRERLCILGSTGSIGVSTLAVAELHPDRFEIFALTGHRRVAELAAQCVRHRPRLAAVCDAAAAVQLRDLLAGTGCPTEIVFGPEALCELAAHAQTDVVMGAIVGFAGLRPCLAAVRAGKRLLLANKEALVVGGALFMRAVAESGATLLPVDSEHSAIHQCLHGLPAGRRESIARIVLTASGGPFRTWDPALLPDVTPAQAVAHPNWSMGRKISVDSATMMNKALEIIEARWLFDLPPEKIAAVIHPQSVVHSMVEMVDGAVLAQLGTPDMRGPIAYALGHPQRIETGAPALDFLGQKPLTFEPPDPARFPSLGLAWQVLRAGGGASGVLNAANEEAVAAFLDGRIRFTDIHAVVETTLAELAGQPEGATIAELVELDAHARRHAARSIERRARAVA